MSKGGGTTTNTVTQDSDPWAPLQPYILGYGGNSGGASNASGPIANSRSGSLGEVAGSAFRGGIAGLQEELRGVEALDAMNSSQNYGQYSGWNTNLSGNPTQSTAAGIGSNIGVGNTSVPGILPEAAVLFNQGPNEYYQGQGVAGINPNLQSGLDMSAGLVDRGYGSNMQGMDTLGGVMSGSDPVSQYYSSVMGGDYMGGDQFMSAYGNDIMDNVNSRFGASGRSFSPAAAKAMTNEMGGVASRLYSDERNRQMQAASGMGGNMMSAAMAAPGIENQMYGMQNQDINALMQSGMAQRGLDQEILNESRQKWDFEQNADWANLERYNNMITNIMHGAPAGGTTTSTSPYYSNPVAGAAGGAMGGAALASQMGWAGPWGALAGGVLGYFGS